MNLQFTQEELNFQKEVRDWITENYPEDMKDRLMNSPNGHVTKEKHTFRPPEDSPCGLGLWEPFGNHVGAIWEPFGAILGAMSQHDAPSWPAETHEEAILG